MFEERLAKELKKLKEAKKEGPINIAWDGKPEKYTYTPEDSELKLDPNAAYVHFVCNETIKGVQFATEPSVDESNATSATRTTMVECRFLCLMDLFLLLCVLISFGAA